MAKKSNYARPLIEVREPILAYFKRWHQRPVLIGQISMELRCSLREVEGYLEELMDEGQIREATALECKESGITFGYMKCSESERCTTRHGDSSA